LKPLLGAIDEIVGMTDDVLEISLKSPRPNFLQLLAQPEMAVLREGEGLGPFRAAPAEDGAISLTLPAPEEDAPEQDERAPPLLLRGEAAGLAVARFAEGETDLVLGGTLGDLPLARAARPPAASLVFDPAPGLFGLIFTGTDGRFAAPEARRALAMAIDRGAIAQRLGVAVLQPRDTIVPAGVAEAPQPAFPGWAAAPLPDRRAEAARLLAALPDGAPAEVRVAMPEGQGYAILFAHLRRDWATVGLRAERVAPNAPADLRLIDAVAPASLATWYLRHFTCDASRICDPAADEMLAAARIAPAPAARRAMIANADRILTDLTPFIPLSNPVRWSLVSPRLTGFRPNPFGRHPAGELIRLAP
jgi:peptide/nickel transport system substrate-binding protein